MRCKSPHQSEKILTAAAQLFATHRFHEARMDDIASLADVGKGTLYRYFKDKEELYLALLARASAGLQASLCQGLHHAGSPRQRLIAVVHELIRYLDEHPHIFDLIQHAEVMHKPGQSFPWQQTRDQTVALVKGLLQEVRGQASLPSIDLDLAALMLLGGLRAVLRFGKRPRPVTLAAHLVDTFLEGFAPAASR